MHIKLTGCERNEGVKGGMRKHDFDYVFTRTAEA